MCKSSFRLLWAAPSWVAPATMAANAAFLATRAPGIGLCLFESDACLAYGREDWPQEVPDIQWHLHLPLDLPWGDVDQVVRICALLCERAAYLRPRLAVLHAPKGRQQAKKLARFAQLWDSQVPVALENTSWCDVWGLGEHFLQQHRLEFCLDVAHALCYGQWKLLRSPLVEYAALWHWSAPGDADRHWPLTRLTESEKRESRQLLRRSREDSTHLLEIFNWAGILASLPELRALAEEQ